MAEGDGSRNFRSAYYEKLGFCGNDEKDYLDMLIASSSLEPDKLTDLWTEKSGELDRKVVEALKVSLGVECGRNNPFDEFANVRRVRAEHFNSLKHHLEVLIEHNVVIKDRLKKCSKQIITKQIQQVPQKGLDLDNNSQHIQRNHNDFPKNYENGESQRQSDTDSTRATNQNTGGNNSEPEIKDARDQPHQLTKENTSSSSSSTSSSSQINCVVDQQATKRVSPFSSNGTINNSSQMRAQNGSGGGGRSCKGLLGNIESNPGSLITLMYLLEAGRLDTSDIELQLQSEYCQKLFPMATFFVNVAGDLQEAFFLFRNFTNNILNKSSPEV